MTQLTEAAWIKVVTASRTIVAKNTGFLPNLQDNTQRHDRNTFFMSLSDKPLVIIKTAHQNVLSFSALKEMVDSLTNNLH